MSSGQRANPGTNSRSCEEKTERLTPLQEVQLRPSAWKMVVLLLRRSLSCQISNFLLYFAYQSCKGEGVQYLVRSMSRVVSLRVLVLYELPRSKNSLGRSTIPSYPRARKRILRLTRGYPSHLIHDDDELNKDTSQLCFDHQDTRNEDPALQEGSCLDGTILGSDSSQHDTRRFHDPHEGMIPARMIRSYKARYHKN